MKKKNIPEEDYAELRESCLPACFQKRDAARTARRTRCMHGRAAAVSMHSSVSYTLLYVAAAAEPRLRFYELAKGNGEEAKEGSRVLVSPAGCWQHWVGPLLFLGSQWSLRLLNCSGGYSSMLPSCMWSQVHFECKYRGLSVVSTRSARVLSGNRTVAEVGSTLCGAVEVEGAAPACLPACLRGTCSCSLLRLPADPLPAFLSFPPTALCHAAL